MINRLICRLLMAIFSVIVISCSEEQVMAQSTPYMDIYITIDGKTLPVHLVDNVATCELVRLLQQSPITCEVEDYGGFEKVGAFGQSLPTDNSQTTTEAGDVVLYNGNQIVLFYGSNTWSYTTLGHIAYSSLSELKEFLKAGEGRAYITLSVAETSGIILPSAEKQVGKMYALNGIELKQESAEGVYIKDGKLVSSYKR